MKPVDTYGDSELEAGTAMMPPFTAFCQKGLKPNSPNQAVEGLWRDTYVYYGVLRIAVHTISIWLWINTYTYHF